MLNYTIHETCIRLFRYHGRIGYVHVNRYLSSAVVVMRQLLIRTVITVGLYFYKNRQQMLKFNNWMYKINMMMFITYSSKPFSRVLLLKFCCSWLFGLVTDTSGWFWLAYPKRTINQTVAKISGKPTLVCSYTSWFLLPKKKILSLNYFGWFEWFDLSSECFLHGHLKSIKQKP